MGRGSRYWKPVPRQVPHRSLLQPRGTLLDVDSTERSQCKSGSLQTPSWAVLQDRFAGHDRQLA